MKRIMLVMLLVLATFIVAAADFEISIQQCPKEVIRGVPINISCEVQNCSGQLLNVSYGSHGFPITVKIYSMDGAEVEPCMTETGKRYPFFEEIPPNWHKTFSFPVCIAVPGDYKAVIGLSSKGPYKNSKGVEIQAWEGNIISNCVVITMKEPVGIDKEAFDYFKGEPLSNPTVLLQKFPTSTYAGYELCKGGPSLKRAAEIDDAKRDMDWAVPKGASPEDQQKRRDTIRQGYEEYATRVRNFLKVHPDFVKADVLRKNLAVFLLYLDRRSEAIEQLEILSKMEGKNAEEAREVLGCLEGKKKMEAAPVEKSVPEAKGNR